MQKIHKTFFKTIITLLTLVLTNFTDVESADEFFISKAESAPSAKNKFEKLKVGYVVNTGFMSEDRPGHTVGYGYEYMEFLENYIPCEFEYIVFDDWTDLLDKLDTGEIDIIPNLPGDHKWLINAKSTDHVVGRFPMELVITSEQIKPQINLARVRTNYDTPGLDEVARAEGFQYNLINYKTYQDIVNAYERGEVDGYVDAMLFYRKSKPTYAVFDRQNYRLSVRADRQDLLDRLNWAMDQLLLDQSDIRDVLKRKYFLKEGFPLLLSRDEKNFLAEKKKLRTAVLFYQKPRVYYDDEGNLSGLMVDIINRISEDLNVEIEIVETKSYEEARDLIQNGEIDFIADAISDFSWAEKYNINPTQKFFQMDYVPVTRENYVLESSKNPKVACVDGMFYTMNFIEMNFPKENIVYLQNFEECLKAVNNGRADVVYVNRDSVYSFIDSAGTYDLEVGAVSAYSQSVGLGTNLNGDLRLWHILNKEINHIDVSWVRDMLAKHQQTTSAINWKRIAYHNIFAIVLFAIFLTVIIGAYIYKRNINKKNFEMVQRMAYTDFRYNLPNVRWLEKEVPATFQKLKEEQPELKTFFAVFSMMSNAVMTQNLGYKIMDSQFRVLANGLKTSEPVIFIAAGIDVGHLICFCKSESDEKIFDWATKIIESYSYMDTADANARIVIHMKAGISRYDENLDINQAIGRAVIACQQNASNEVKLFDEKLEETLTTEHDIENRMIYALENDEFKAWYQPKYDIKTRRIVGAEALVRWISPETGFMSPGKFIPLFEQNGFVIQVDYYILEKTCQLQRERLDAGKEVVPISVNQSRLHMTEDGYLDKMRAIIEKYNLPPNLIELEITETMFGDFDKKAARQNAERIITGLKEIGFMISVDDFGAGYSSFSLLSSLPMDILKIDRSVLTGADTSQKMKKILGKVIELGQSLGMGVICEGIETVEEENLLLSLGCRYGQGFLNAKPMPVNDFIAFFEKRNAEVSANGF
ncbi:MAG: EAL domain-containing protein [Selenomonadaceae bacterium]|nr:EAL domain-containing protein [Selenomonadaceae bacterium]